MPLRFGCLLLLVPYAHPHLANVALLFSLLPNNGGKEMSQAWSLFSF